MHKPALRATFVFFVLGSLWILGSDYLLSLFFEEESFLLAQNVKGVFFILVSSIILYLVLRREQENLIKSEKNYERLFYDNPVPVWVFDPRTNYIVAANKAASIIYGYTIKEMIGLDCNLLKADFTSLKEKLNETSETELQATGVAVHIKKDGELFFVKERKHETLFKGKMLTLVMAISVDKLIKLENRILKQNRKLREISDFQSHSLRRPVANILGLAQLVKNQSSVMTEEEEIFDKLEHEAIELDKMIKNIVKKADDLDF